MDEREKKKKKKRKRKKKRNDAVYVCVHVCECVCTLGKKGECERSEQTKGRVRMDERGKAGTKNAGASGIGWSFTEYFVRSFCTSATKGRKEKEKTDSRR
ncbi:hypothetical protein K0M31_011973 [Melipona bicolor]|uniref:Uncharacterized protein n=1 Tax=Melipona bicolor TaxID=60889 RepID=A0AA40GAT4_9HYME|nr:hypothetical protein K0M31_011973 [Melipona bicolor]